MTSFRWASKVRLSPSPDGEEGVWMFAGKKEDGETMVREDPNGATTRVTVEVLERFHAAERMAADEVIEFGKRLDDDDRWDV